MRYPGGKNQSGVFQAIINQILPHDFYYEGFVGSGAVLRHKLPAGESYAIDKDPRALELVRGAVPNLKLIRGDAVKKLAALRWKDDRARRTVVYLDPPYLSSTRSSGRRMYRHEFMTEEEHAGLLAVCQELPCNVILSGLDSALYRHELRAWRRVEIPTVNRAGARVTEILWLNYGEPIELHDYRYLGVNRVQRQYFKRYQQRMRARILAMPALRRAALFQAVDELRSTAAGDGCT